MKKDISTLPKWAQKIIKDQEEENKLLAMKANNLKKIVYRLDEGRGEWFTLFHPKLARRKGVTNLFILQHNHAQAVCSLGEQDFIMVCKAGSEVTA